MISASGKSLSLTGFFAILLLVFLQSCDTFLGDSERDLLNKDLESLVLEATDGVGKSALISFDDSEISQIPADPKNPLSPSKIELGKFLFHDTRLGHNSLLEEGQYSYSCASCHHQLAGFQAGIRQGIGEGGLGFGTIGELRRRNPEYHEDDISVGYVRAPSILNVATQSLLGWDGRYGSGGENESTVDRWRGAGVELNALGYEAVETQAIAAMSEFRLSVEAIREIASYQELFGQSFPERIESEQITDTTAALAIAAFERTVAPSKAPFQKWLRGDQLALSGDQLKGAILFFGKANCAKCHIGPGLSDGKFHALGMSDLEGIGVVENPSVQDEISLGRGGFSGNVEDNYKFKTPQLYNLKDPLLFGHGSSFFALKELLRYKNLAQAENDQARDQLSPDFSPLRLSTEEIDHLVSFLGGALRDPKLIRFSTKTVPSGDCVPNNDIRSKEDLDCRVF